MTPEDRTEMLALFEKVVAPLLAVTQEHEELIRRLQAQVTELLEDLPVDTSSIDDHYIAPNGHDGEISPFERAELERVFKITTWGNMTVEAVRRHIQTLGQTPTEHMMHERMALLGNLFYSALSLGQIWQLSLEKVRALAYFYCKAGVLYYDTTKYAYVKMSSSDIEK